MAATRPRSNQVLFPVGPVHGEAFSARRRSGVRSQLSDRPGQRRSEKIVGTHGGVLDLKIPANREIVKGWLTTQS
jgi:hypothetical protein